MIIFSLFFSLFDFESTLILLLCSENTFFFKYCPHGKSSNNSNFAQEATF